MRYDLDGTHYDDDGSEEGVTVIEDDGINIGCPAAGCNEYELTRDLDFDNPDSYRSGIINPLWTDGGGPATGWIPIGNNKGTGIAQDANRFNAIFDGNGNTITDLTINRNDTDTTITDGDGNNNVGLFGYIGANGAVRRLNLAGAQIRFTSITRTGLEFRHPSASGSAMGYRC